jgi:hypothetical protein
VTAEDPETTWEALLAFPVALIVLVVIVMPAIFLSWRRDRKRKRQQTLLPYLRADWSFRGSWVSNITAGAALLTAVFAATDVVTVLIGEHSKDAMALATVGSAIALAFTAAAPVILALSQRDRWVPTSGLMLAAAVTLAGAYGELWVLAEAARDLGIHGHEVWVAIVQVVAAGLLTWYAVSSLRGLLTTGTSNPATSEDGARARRAALL